MGLILVKIASIKKITDKTIKENTKRFSSPAINKLNSFEIKKDKKLAFIEILFLYGLAKSQNIDIKNVKFLANKSPTIKNSEMKFSISHNGDYCALAFSKENVAIDIQKKFNKNYQKVINRVFSEKEKNLVINSAKKAEEFTKIWCCKEAAYKFQRSSKNNNFIIQKNKGDYQTKIDGKLANFNVFNFKKYIVSICCCGKTIININYVDKIEKW